MSECKNDTVLDAHVLATDFKDLRQLAFNNDGTKLYVADYGAGNVTIFHPGKEPPKIAFENLHKPHGVAVDAQGQVCVSTEIPKEDTHVMGMFDGSGGGYGHKGLRELVCMSGLVFAIGNSGQTLVCCQQSDQGRVRLSNALPVPGSVSLTGVCRSADGKEFILSDFHSSTLFRVQVAVQDKGSEGVRIDLLKDVGTVKCDQDLKSPGPVAVAKDGSIFVATCVQPLVLFRILPQGQCLLIAKGSFRGLAFHPLTGDLYATTEHSLVMFKMGHLSPQIPNHLEPNTFKELLESIQQDHAKLTEKIKLLHKMTEEKDQELFMVCFEGPNPSDWMTMTKKDNTHAYRVCKVVLQPGTSVPVCIKTDKSVVDTCTLTVPGPGTTRMQVRTRNEKQMTFEFDKDCVVEQVIYSFSLF